MTDLEQEIKQLEDELKLRGVIDVKFTWTPDIKTRNVEDVQLDVRNFLRAWLDRESTPLTDLGDPPSMRT